MERLGLHADGEGSSVSADMQTPADSNLHGLVESALPEGGMNVNSLDLPSPGPAMAIPSGQMPSHSMPVGPGNMPPPQWTPQQQQQLQTNIDLLPQQLGGVMLTQPKPRMGGRQSLPPGPNRPPWRAPRKSQRPMNKAFDTLGLTYPGASNGAQYASAMPQQQPGQRLGQLGIGGPVTTPNSNADQPTKDWHRNVAIDLRNHQVDKLVQAILPSPQREVLHDPRRENLIHYARKVELEMYKNANSREEYQHMLAEKICRIEKELEEKRSRRQNPSQTQGQRQPQMQQGLPQQQQPQQQQLSGASPNNRSHGSQNKMPAVPGNSVSTMNGPNSIQQLSSVGPSFVPSYSRPPSTDPTASPRLP